MAAKKTSFEENIRRLDEIVRALEQGSAPLEQSLALFEEGAGLIKTCSAMLDKAEQTVTKLSKGTDGEPVEEPFAAE
ncbi:MAG: exodeoxyribonuclease VII small subunit [Oscillospiraceae bacterium]|jgi:exodeoxyribonuclease VII small subunit|nr:exodeoxyribonuclease VII small subunit [Oscillospiraceae bacterium]